MRSNFILLILSVFIISSCTTGQKSLQQGNFYDALMKAVNRLGSDPDNRKASQVVREGYPMAMAYYQEEIDKMLTGNDPFKWNQTLDVMNTVNQISDEIRRIPAARQLVTSPKTYTSELINVQNHAAQEHYDAGMDLLARNTRETAKEAFYHFRNADALVHGFKDVAAKMQKAKEMATLTVVVEQIPVNGKYEYSAQFFYDNVFQMLNQKFQEKDFVHFFSPEEAERVKLKYPDMVLRMGFYDFFIDRPQHFEEEKDLAKQIEEKYEVKVSRDSTVTKTRLVTKKGKIRIVTDQVASGGLLEIKCVDFQSQKIIFTDKVPGQFTWQNQYGVFVGEKEVLDNNLANIISNKVQMPPASQDMFVLFTKPIFNQLTSKLVNYFSQYN